VPYGYWQDQPNARLAPFLTGFSMLPVTKKSKSRKRTRRAHHALKPVTLSPCPHCGKLKLPHAACGVCGFVSSKLILPKDEQEE